MTMANLAGLLQSFFTDRLLSQLGASPHTVASYRDTFRLLLVFASERLRRTPSQLPNHRFPFRSSKMANTLLSTKPSVVVKVINCFSSIPLSS